MDILYLPIRIAFPVIAATLLGPDESFVVYICLHESSILRHALKQTSKELPLTSQMNQLVCVLSRFDCTVVPTTENLFKLIVDVSRHVFLGKPLGLLYAMSAGVPSFQQRFWSNSVEKLFQLYKALNATPAIVLSLLEEPEFENEAESKVLYYCTSFIGNCKQEELRSLLRFITGSSVVIDQPIKVSFNTLDGIGKHPISHSCECSIELPTTYETYMELSKISTVFWHIRTHGSCKLYKYNNCLSWADKLSEEQKGVPHQRGLAYHFLPYSKTNDNR